MPQRDPDRVGLMQAFMHWVWADCSFLFPDYPICVPYIFIFRRRRWGGHIRFSRKNPALWGRFSRPICNTCMSRDFEGTNDFQRFRHVKKWFLNKGKPQPRYFLLLKVRLYILFLSLYVIDWHVLFLCRKFTSRYPRSPRDTLPSSRYSTPGRSTWYTSTKVTYSQRLVRDVYYIVSKFLTEHCIQNGRIIIVK